MLERLNQLGTEHINYIITNHAEQGLSGTLPQIIERYPETQVVCTLKCKEMLVDLLLVPQDRFLTVEDGATLSLGDRTLEFIHAPWVHLPETILLYITS